MPILLQETHALLDARGGDHSRSTGSDNVESPKGIKIDALNAYNIYIKEQYQNKNNGRHMEVNISTDKLMVVITILYPSTLAIYLKV